VLKQALRGYGDVLLDSARFDREVRADLLIAVASTLREKYLERFPTHGREKCRDLDQLLLSAYGPLWPCSTIGRVSKCAYRLHPAGNGVVSSALVDPQIEKHPTQ